MKRIRIFDTASELADSFANEIIQLVDEAGKRKKPFNLMLSGGSTPELLYKSLSLHTPAGFNWDHVNFYWGDERCVPEYDPESNFGAAKKLWLNNIPGAEKQLHPLYNGYSQDKELEMCEMVLREAGIIDLVILGTGEDGHFASVFPDNPSLFRSGELCAFAEHPLSGQLRITVTPYFLQTQAKSIVFLVTGVKKAGIIERILHTGKDPGEFIPARQLQDSCDQISWYLDKMAASNLKTTE
jgi:6-phosphogluconolactonase